MTLRLGWAALLCVVAAALAPAPVGAQDNPPPRITHADFAASAPNSYRLDLYVSEQVTAASSFTPTGLKVTNVTVDSVTMGTFSQHWILEGRLLGTGELKIALPAGVLRDLDSAPSLAYEFSHEWKRPLVTIASAATSPLDGDIDVTITFSEEVTGFTQDDLVIGVNTSVVAFGGAGADYTVTLARPRANGTVTVHVPGGAATAAAGYGQTNFASELFARSFTLTLTAAITSTARAPVRGSFNIAFLFSQALVTGSFTVGDLVVDNGAAAFLLGSGRGFTATVTAAASGAVTVRLPEGVVMDADGNLNSAAAFTIAADLRGVAVSPTSLQVDEPGGTATYTVALREAPSGSVTIAAASKHTDRATVSPASLTFTTADWSAAQTVTVTGVDDATTGDRSTLIAHTVTGADYAGVAATDVRVTVVDDDLPVATLELSPDEINEFGTSVRSTITATLSEASSANTFLTVTAVAVPPATKSDFEQVGTELTIAAGKLASTGAVTIEAVNQEAFGTRLVSVSATVSNAQGVRDPADQTLTILDALQPNITATFESSQATFAGDSGTFTNDNEFTVPITFSESVQGLDTDDFVGTNAVATDITSETNGYVVTFAGERQGPVDVVLPAGSVQNADADAPSTNAQSNRFTLAHLDFRPTMTLATTAVQPVIGDVPVTITFSEPVTGFTKSDLQLTVTYPNDPTMPTTTPHPSPS